MEILVVIILIIGITFSIASLSAAPWVPMRQSDVQRVLVIIKSAKVTRKNFLELGSGDGRLLAAVAGLGWKATGYEISVLPLLISFTRRVFSKFAYTVKMKNFWTAPIKDAAVIFVFLIPRTLVRFKNKIEQEAAPGTIVINYVWPIPGWEPVAVLTAPGASKLYVYER